MIKIPSFYFVGLAFLNLIMDSLHSKFSFFDVIFIILAGLPLLVDKKWLYQIFGALVSMSSLYIVFAVFISNIKDIQQNQIQPLWTYGMGYVISLVTLFFGLIMTRIISINLKKSVV
ncbi:hypothetical protein SAMN05421664_1756 [Chryseobacterium soldanellicola]|uniref:Uncharacterized protein n=1 Tax=Chryseobacterium soldanellicola TaxID=311333 RepID=A0A1H1B871_9FLAO|nr:hypothetical protein [Chryseobacterium soldanellicola]SDQ47971.1 hypothetical protein SAMN05421664_1756 [Chryseobacterium soldanellicola]